MREKRIIKAILMFALLTSSTFPVVVIQAGISPPLLSDQNVYVGDIITVSGSPDDVTSGATINVYWDIAVGENAWLLNTTTGNPDGSYELWIIIPESVNGTHYIWVEDTATESLVRSDGITVHREIRVRPWLGLPYDEITVGGKGFGAENEITIVFSNSTYSSVVSTSPSIVETDEYGTFSCTIEIPDVDYGEYFINVTDDVSTVNVVESFVVGASIYLTPDEGPEGTVIGVLGRGFSNTGVTLTGGNITWDGIHSAQIIGDVIDVSAEGEFSGYFVAPSFGVGHYLIEVTDGVFIAGAYFEINDTAAIDVDPSNGVPGAPISVSGANFTQKSGVEVTITLGTATFTTTTLVDGTWTTNFTVPAIEFRNYNVTAVDEYGVNATTVFEVISVSIAVVLNPITGPSGSNVSLTGVGFGNGLFNVTFGDILVYEAGVVTNEQISTYFTVPTIDPGTYSVTVVDEELNELSTIFTVSNTTSLSWSPSYVSVYYNMSIYGEHFTELEGTSLEFYVYNSTWSYDITGRVNSTYSYSATTVTEYGNFTGYWIVPDVLIIGNTYTVNATDANGLYASFTFSLSEEAMEIGPLLTTYQPGDTVAFTINMTFARADAYMTISDPFGYPYWTSTFTAGDWVSVGGFQVVPFNSQVDDVSWLPFTLPAGAVNGLWSWTIWSREDSVISSGSFSVVDDSAEPQLNEFTLNVSAGWNMVSIPFLPSDPSADSVLSEVAFYQLVTWIGTGYEVATEFELGKGYWLLVLEETNITITG